jgi:hypothetical protein
MQDTEHNMNVCPYNNTCTGKTETCWEEPMALLHAKPIIEEKFWIVENNDGSRLGTLRKNEDNRFVLSNKEGIKFFKTKESLKKEFGRDFFVKIKKEANDAQPLEVHGYPSSVKPHNPMFDVQRKLPLFTKSKDSKSLYCAGYYTIKFEKGWVKSFCPKLITIQRYPSQGPFKTELEMKQVLASVSKKP